MTTRLHTLLQGAILYVRLATFLGIGWLVAFFALKFTKVFDCQYKNQDQALASGRRQLASLLPRNHHLTVHSACLLCLCVTQRDRWWLDQKAIYILYVCTGSICFLLSLAGVVCGGRRITKAFRSGKRW